MQIHTLENPEHALILRKKTEAVSFPLSTDVQNFIVALKDKLIDTCGVGLAAPQVGIPLKICAVHISADAAAVRENAHTVPLTVLINPHYEPTSDSQFFYDWEGCMSVGFLMGKVKRHNSILLTAQDENGQPIRKIVKGFLARVLQHEIDHLNQTLIVDHLENEPIKGSPQEMTKLRREELSDDKRKIFDSIIQKQQIANRQFKDK